jgi:hypothetical protein
MKKVVEKCILGSGIRSAFRFGFDDFSLIGASRQSLSRKKGGKSLK